MPSPAAFALASAAGLLLAWPCEGVWRQAIAGLGFPLSAVATGAVTGTALGLPAWAWLLMLLPLLALYPLRAWRDAPFFPTPDCALEGLDSVIAQPQRLLDVGCGLGDGLRALHRVWPQAELQGVEWSAPLAWAAALRLRLLGVKASVRRGDMWAAPWSGQDVIYVFQRPESMRRVFEKATRELTAGAWLVSLEFEVPGQQPVARLQGPGRKPVWLYQPAGPLAARMPRSIPTAAGR
jgi:hypothetical protein